MQWIWQLKNWPNFDWNATLFMELEQQFLQNNAISIGTVKHIPFENIEVLHIEILTQEALSTSNIEGEILQRDSVQSSIRKHLGLQVNDNRKTKASESGIAELMISVYKDFNKKLSHSIFYDWHSMINNGRRDLESLGAYRNHIEPMQIVSGNLMQHKVFYEAPPSVNVKKEMDYFISWYNSNVYNKNLPTIVFAGIVHLYFECIHPFEDGNGRVGRALVEKAISQRLGKPSLHSFSKIIEDNKKEYYNALQQCNHSLEITKWLLYFSKTIIDAQRYTMQMIDFSIAKSKFFNKFSLLINDRQEKVLLRMFDAGVKGFKGGLSAGNYKSITGTSPATATRDLQELVTLSALVQTGQLKHMRYNLNLKNL